MIDNPLLLRLFILAILLLLSAFFSACEVSFFSINKIKLESMRDRGSKRERAIYFLLKTPRKLLVTIYIGNEIVNVGIAAIVTSTMIHLYGPAALVPSMAVSLFLLLQFGEIVPKTLAINNSVAFASSAAYPLKIFALLMSPILYLVTSFADFLISLAGGKKTLTETKVSEEEIRTLIEISEEAGELPSEEKEMIENVFDFGDIPVSEVMTPRRDIFSLEVSEPLDSIFTKLNGQYFSRIPVYEGSIDNILGILYAKDLLQYADRKEKDIEIKELLHSAFIIPESKKLNELLNDFQKKKVHLAIVLDEHAGVDGLVTLDDLMEELFGDPEDETEIVSLGKGKYKIAGTAPISELNETIQATLSHDKFDTVGGLVFNTFGRVPKRGETTIFENLVFTVEKMKGNRIISVRLHLMPIPDAKNSKETAQKT